MSDLPPDDSKKGSVEFMACLAGAHTRASPWSEFDDGGKLVLELPESDAAVWALLRKLKKHRLKVTVEDCGSFQEG